MMNLDFTEQENAFRAECRSWLEANVPKHSLPSGDTREGYALHLEWERKLFDAGWSCVSWPKQYGGREASLYEWLIFEEEYYRAGGPQPTVGSQRPSTKIASSGCRPSRASVRWKMRASGFMMPSYAEPTMRSNASAMG